MRAALEVRGGKVHILGETWTIIPKSKDHDEYLKECDGYADKTTRTIVIPDGPPQDNELGDWKIYLKKIKRHEILHAFLFESGLHENFTHPQFGHDETYLDWFAAQFPKILAAYEEADAL